MLDLTRLEQLADLAHQQWSGWMEYLFSKCTENQDGTVTIPKWAVERWKRQIETKYIDLPEEEKESDRDEARRVLEVFKNALDLILIIKPGPELDELVSLKVMGDVPHRRYYPEYSTKISEAWKVIEKMAQKEGIMNFRLRLFCDDLPQYTCSFTDPPSKGYALEETAPLAICRAALRAVIEI